MSVTIGRLAAALSLCALTCLSATTPSQAQLFSSVPLNTADLEGFAPPAKLSFFSQEFWAVNRWQKNDDPASTFELLVSIDPGRLANILHYAPIVAGLDAEPRRTFTYTQADAQMDSLSSGQARGALVCGVPSVRLHGSSAMHGAKREVYVLAENRARLGWVAFGTEPGGAAQDSALTGALPTMCPASIQQAIAAGAPAGWNQVKPAWMHSVATWMGGDESIDFIAVDPSASISDASRAAEQMVQDPPDNAVMGTPVQKTLCGKPALTVDWSGRGSKNTGTPNLMRETVVAGSKAYYAIFDESESGATGLTQQNTIDSFCPTGDR